MVEGIIAIVLGAMILADGVMTWFADLSFFFEGINPAFSVAVGVVIIILGSSVLEEGEK